MSAMGEQGESGRGAITISDMGVVFNARGTMVEAVSSVDLKVQPGEFVSLIGPSGCGKSTLLNIVLRRADIRQRAG